MSDSEENAQSTPEKVSGVNGGSGDDATPTKTAEDSKAEPSSDGEHSSPEKQDDKKEEKPSTTDADTEEEPKPGLLEQPVVVEGKRQRKKTERLSEKISEHQESESKAKEIVIPEGQGVALGEMEYISFQINKNKSEDLKLLHRILFGKPGTLNEVKRNIRKFNGFQFERESKDHEKKMDILSRVFVAPLKQMLEIVGLERSGNKEELVTRLLDFLYKPVDSGKKVPKSKRRKSKGEKGKRKRKSKGADKGKKSAAAVKGSDGSDSDSDGGGGKSDSDDEDNDEQESDSETPPPKKAKVEKKKVNKTPKKKATPKKSTKKTKSEEELLPSNSDSDSDSDDEPLVKKKKPPTDEEIRDVVKKILDGADLEEITMKSVCKKVYDKYPDFDLIPRKSFIKATVKEIIN